MSADQRSPVPTAPQLDEVLASQKSAEIRLSALYKSGERGQAALSDLVNTVRQCAFEAVTNLSVSFTNDLTISRRGKLRSRSAQNPKQNLISPIDQLRLILTRAPGRIVDRHAEPFDSKITRYISMPATVQRSFLTSVREAVGPELSMLVASPEVDEQALTARIEEYVSTKRLRPGSDDATFEEGGRVLKSATLQRSIQAFIQTFPEGLGGPLQDTKTLEALIPLADNLIEQRIKELQAFVEAPPFDLAGSFALPLEKPVMFWTEKQMCALDAIAQQIARGIDLKKSFNLENARKTKLEFLAIDPDSDGLLPWTAYFLEAVVENGSNKEIAAIAKQQLDRTSELFSQFLL